jgi:type 1 glutamine amidotransferase
MRRLARVVAFVGLLSAIGHWAGLARAEEGSGYRSLFDGKSLEGWDGDPKLWSVQDGLLVGQTSAEDPLKKNTFLIWRGGEPGDFVMELEYKIEGGNSGIQYRSFELPQLPDRKWGIGGYQADIDDARGYAGINYGEQFRGILAQRGTESVVGADHKSKAVATFAKTDDLKNKIKERDWNRYSIVARGNRMTHYINGWKTSVTIDDDVEMRRDKGLIALQLHVGPPMKVQFRTIKLRELPPKADAAGKQKIVFVAGNPSHGYGAHEHRAGSMLLSRALEESGLPVTTTMVTNGWPTDEKVFDDAAAVVIYCDGGAGHPINAHVDELKKIMDKGTGLALLHYAVEIPAGKSGDALLDWTGGYFEANWSVNPHWTAEYAKFPQHPIARGVKPFTINDEWYYHMRFRPNMEGVLPILSALPPESTLSRPDGPHSGNAAVREAVKNGEQQYMAWARERPDGGRGFGFTGGHDHWNWGNDDFRKLVLNAICWAAKVDVPPEGVPSRSLGLDDLLVNIDKVVPKDFNPDDKQKLLDSWKTGSTSAGGK